MQNINIEDKIILCNIFNIEIRPKEINHKEAIIIVKNNGKIKTGTNIYNFKTKNELYNLFYTIQELYLLYFEKIIAIYNENDIQKKINNYEMEQRRNGVFS